MIKSESNDKEQEQRIDTYKEANLPGGITAKIFEKSIAIKADKLKA